MPLHNKILMTGGGNMRPLLSADMKENNRALVYQYILSKTGRTVTRTEIADHTGISTPTMLKIFDFLERRGIISSNGEERSGERGRRSNLYRFNPNAAFALGAAYDGQMLDISLVNLNYETVLRRSEPVSTDITHLLSELLPDRVAAFTNGFGPILGIGISLPAIVDTVRKSIRHPALAILDAKQSKGNLGDECALLEQNLELPVLLENDVNCAAVAEFRTRELGDDDDFVYLMIGSGLGAGLILEGKLRRGAHYSCGEVGFMVTDHAYSLRAGEPGHMEWELYSYTREQFGVDIVKDGPSTFPHDLVVHMSKELALMIANLANSLDISNFVLGGYVFEKFGFSLIKLVNKRLRELCLHDILVTGAICENASSKGAASLLIDERLDALLSDRTIFGTAENGDTTIQHSPA